MSPQAKKFLKNTKARVLPFSVLVLMIVACFSAVLFLNPSSDNTVSAAAASQFLYYKEITLESDQVNTTLTNFPVLINLSSDTDLASDCLDSGWDIAFFADDQTTQLNHEIERFNGTTGALIAWVNVTVLYGGTDTTIYMYYSDSDIGSSAENSGGTWDSDYLAVYHMDDAVGSLDDSTSNTHDATQDGDRPTDADDHEIEGKIGYCVDYDGYGNAGDSESHDMPSLGQSNADWESDGFTIESWDYHTHSGQSGYYTLFYYYDMNSYILRDGSNVITFSVVDDGDSSHDITGKTVANNNWIYNVGVWNPSLTNEVRFYCDGVLQGTDSSDTLKEIGASQKRGIGANQADNWGIDGHMDEVRISRIARNSSWIVTTYNNIVNSSFVTLGSEQSQAGVNGDYTIDLTNTTGTSFTWNGEPGDTIWANNTGTQNETMYIYTNVSGTSDNCTDIYIDITDFNADIYQENVSIEVRNATDGVWNGTTKVFPAADGNVTLNATTWAEGWCHGTNPFPIIYYNSTIEMRLKVTIPTTASSGTKTNSGSWQAIWKVLT